MWVEAVISAVLVVCFISGECLQFVDKRGPYRTKAECEKRGEEMLDTAKQFLSPRPFKWQLLCTRTTEEET